MMMMMEVMIMMIIIRMMMMMEVMIMMIIIRMMMMMITTVPLLHVSQYSTLQYVPKDIIPTSFPLVGHRFGGLRADAMHHVLVVLQQMVRG